MALMALMARTSLMAQILVMGEEINDQELVINETVLFQKVVKCFDE